MILAVERIHHRHLLRVLNLQICVLAEARILTLTARNKEM